MSISGFRVVRKERSREGQKMDQLENEVFDFSVTNFYEFAL